MLERQSERVERIVPGTTAGHKSCTKDKREVKRRHLERSFKAKVIGRTGDDQRATGVVHTDHRWDQRTEECCA